MVVLKVNQSVNIECCLVNVKVIVNYSVDVKKYFLKLNCFVGNFFGKLVFGKDEICFGYFVVDKLNILLVLINMDGCFFVFEFELIIDVKECQYYCINYIMKVNGVIGGVLVILDFFIKEYNVNIVIFKESNLSVNVWFDFVDVIFFFFDGVVIKECKYCIFGMEDWNMVFNVEQVDGKFVVIIIGLIFGMEYDFCFVINGVNGKIMIVIIEFQK